MGGYGIITVAEINPFQNNNVVFYSIVGRWLVRVNLFNNPFSKRIHFGVDDCLTGDDDGFNSLPHLQGD